MENLNLIGQNEFEEGRLSFSLNEYNIKHISDEKKILEEFLNPEIFKHKDFHKIIREDPKKNPRYLDHPFNLDKLD